jgi:DNA polymerase-3 subunit beta
MEFSIDRAEFLQCLSPTQGVVERRNTLPILANVLLEVKTDLTVAATDLEVHIRRRINAKVKSPGAATVGARKLHELVREDPTNADALAKRYGMGDTDLRVLQNMAIAFSRLGRE